VPNAPTSKPVLPARSYNPCATLAYAIRSNRSAVQREPFASHGERAGRIRAWHTIREGTPLAPEIVFRDPITGRWWLAMAASWSRRDAPVQALQGIFAFRIEAGLDRCVPGRGHARLRRALMARVRRDRGTKDPAIFFSGHESDAPRRSKCNPIGCQFDLASGC